MKVIGYNSSHETSLCQFDTDTWDIDFGDTGGNKTLEYGGDNIVITEAGNYTIELILTVAEYRYSITKN